MLKRHRTPQNSVYNVVTPDDLSFIANAKNILEEKSSAKNSLCLDFLIEFAVEI